MTGFSGCYVAAVGTTTTRSEWWTRRWRRSPKRSECTADAPCVPTTSRERAEVIAHEGQELARKLSEPAATRTRSWCFSAWAQADASRGRPQAPEVVQPCWVGWSVQSWPYSFWPGVSC